MSGRTEEYDRRQPSHDWNSPVFVTPFDPSTRRALVERLTAAGATFGALVPSGNWISPSARFGEGTLVFQPVVVMTNSRFGRFVIVMPNTCVGHDVILEDFVSIGAGACVSGHVTVREGAIVGAGATIVNGTSGKPLVVGANARVAEAAVVTKNVPDGAHVAGNPARRVHLDVPSGPA